MRRDVDHGRLPGPPGWPRAPGHGVPAAGPAGRTRRPGAEDMRYRLLAAVAAVFVGAGLWGAWRYVHGFYVFRGFAPPRDPPGISHSRLLHVRFHSPALGAQRSYDVILPAGYDRAARQGRRFGVLYLLHGAPGRPRTFVDAGAVGVAYDTLLARRETPPFLIVMPDGRNGTLVSDTEWADTARGGPYERFVLDVVHAVDRRWSAVRDRRFRAIAGLSEGGYGAVNIALRRLGTFGIAQSWSGYFTQTATGPYRGASPAALRRASPAAYVGSLRELRRLRLHVLLYSGRRDPNTRQLAPFASALRRAGADVVARAYAGGHDWGLWRREAPMALRDVGAHLGRP
jgi:enterochelin esterase-like enzyme